MTDISVQSHKRAETGSYKGVYFLGLLILFLITVYISVNTGSLNISMEQLLSGLFVKYDPNEPLIWVLRFPRILIVS